MYFRKALDEIQRRRNIFTDEELVVLATLTAIITGGSTIIFTRDKDVLDQFVKLIGVLTKQYQATLFAQRVVDDLPTLDRKALPNTDVMKFYFDVQESYLVKKPVPPNEFVDWVLPRDHRIVNISCILLGGPPSNLSFTILPFIGEVEMISLLDAKVRSLGLNSDLLEGHNCHVTGFPIGIENPREYVMIAADQIVPAADMSLQFSVLDLMQIVYHCELWQKF